MTPEFVGPISIVALMVMVLVRIPVAVALGVVGVCGYAAVDGWPRALNRLGNTPFDIASGYALSVVPLFLLMGAVAARSGMSYDLFRAANALFSGRRGTLAMASIGACAGFGAICGSSLATAAAMSRIAIPEMLRFGYDERLATGAVASGGTLGILIPPSVILVIYAIIAQQSVAELFAAGLVPGLLLAFFHVVVVWVICRVRPAAAPVGPAIPLGEWLRDIRGIWQMLVLFLLSVGGIYVGLFSPTEAATVGAGGAIVLGFATRRIGLRETVDAAFETVRTTAMLFFIIIAAAMYAYFLVQTRLPQGLVDWVAGLGLPPVAVLAVLVAFYIVLGCDPRAAAEHAHSCPLPGHPAVSDRGCGADPIAVPLARRRVVAARCSVSLMRRASRRGGPASFGSPRPVATLERAFPGNRRCPPRGPGSAAQGRSARWSGSPAGPDDRRGSPQSGQFRSNRTCCGP